MLHITASQRAYPYVLSSLELLAHRRALEEYRTELSENLHNKCAAFKPDLHLIAQQPELKASLRAPVLEFLLHLAIKTRVTTGVYYQAVRLFDRYCSKRIVLREQLQLVLATCLWLSAKTYGGCNHIINNTTVPTGGRFHGPNPRARVPRLSELCHMCNDDQKYDEGMFVQMERHILDTLTWDIVEPQVYNWVFNFWENNAIQFEQEEMDDKATIIHTKRFLTECSLLELRLMEIHPSQLAQVILNVLSIHTEESFSTELEIIEPLSPEQLQLYSQCLYDTLLRLPDTMLQFYTRHAGVLQMYHKIVKHCIRVDTTRTPVKMMLPTPPNSRRGSPVGVGH